MREHEFGVRSSNLAHYERRRGDLPRPVGRHLVRQMSQFQLRGTVIEAFNTLNLKLRQDYIYVFPQVSGSSTAQLSS